MLAVIQYGKGYCTLVLHFLLFSIYVNDLPSIIKHSNCHLYADDTIMYAEGDSMEHIEKIMQCHFMFL